MSRILLGWELGSNLGHLSRLLPLARRLKARGHNVLVAARDLALAARMLGPAGIPFVQAPRMSMGPGPSRQPASYADVLRYSGWADAPQLWGMVQAWVNVLRLFNPAVIVLDHSPSALLAARCISMPCVLMGTGFELPPLRQPLPPFPGFSGSTAENAAEAEAEVLENANLSLRAARVPPLRSLADLFNVERRWLTTFAELDHYGVREGERYIGPIGEVEEGVPMEWPSGATQRIFAYLRPDTPDLQVILRSLAASGAAVVCYGPGIASQQTDALGAGRFTLASRPVDLSTLLQGASLCVSYAPAGTVASTLLQGIPQLLAPAHVEAQLTAHRVECMGAGLTLQGNPTEQRVVAMLQTLLSNPLFKTRAAMFAARYKSFDPGRAADDIVEDIHSFLSQRKQSAPHDTRGAGLEC